jgi:hypothetical protein
MIKPYKEKQKNIKTRGNTKMYKELKNTEKSTLKRHTQNSLRHGTLNRKSFTKFS